MVNHRPGPDMSCKEFLDDLKNLPETMRETIHSISLPYSLMNSDKAGNDAEHALNLAQCILRWEEIDVVTIGMPDDLHLYEGPISPEPWSWILPTPLLAAFRKGRWQMIRLLHPRIYPITLVIFFCANIMFYAETYILPWTAQCQLQMLRAHFTLQPTDLDYQNIIAVNDQCARLWGRRGIAVQVKEPTPLFEEEEGTVLEVSWKRTWMRKERRIATRTKSTSQAEVRSISPLQDGASTTLPSFLRYLPEWLVVLCVEHRECFAQDTLKHHLIQKHSATEEEATDVISLSPIDYAAKSWEYVIHPYKAIDRIPELPTVHGYCCSGGYCRYITRNKRDLISHGMATGHDTSLERLCCLQTLSSHPSRIQYFEVLLNGDFVFDEDAYWFYLDKNWVEGGEIV